MAGISTHLDLKPYQVAVSTNRALVRRKWDHLSSFCWQPTAKSAAYAVAKARGFVGDVIAEHNAPPIGPVPPPWGESPGTVYEFAGDNFILVSFGS